MEHFLFTSNDGIWGKQVQGRQMRKEVQVFLCKTWSAGSSTHRPPESVRTTLPTDSVWKSQECSFKMWLILHLPQMLKALKISKIH